MKEPLVPLELCSKFLSSSFTTSISRNIFQRVVSQPIVLFVDYIIAALLIPASDSAFETDRALVRMTRQPTC